MPRSQGETLDLLLGDVRAIGPRRQRFAHMSHVSTLSLVGTLRTTHAFIMRVFSLHRRLLRTWYVEWKYGPRENPNTSQYWDEIWRTDVTGDRSKPELEARIVDLVGSGSTVIDLGCGAGDLVTRLRAEKGAVCTGADFSRAALAQLEAHGFRTLHVNLPKVNSRDASFDVAVCMETLEHVDDYAGVINEMNRITREGGLLILSTPDGALWGAGGEHVHAFTASDLVGALRRYVAVVEAVWLLDGGYPYLLVWGRKDSSARLLADGRNLRTDFDEAT